jgi:hypothetical protein
MTEMRPKIKKKFRIPKNPFLSTLIKLKRMQIDKEEDEVRKIEEARIANENVEAKKKKNMRRFGTIDDAEMNRQIKMRRGTMWDPNTSMIKSIAE